MNKILGIPQNKYDYEFMVALPRADGDYDWYSNHETEEAYDVAKQVGGIVCHNVRISRKRIKENEWYKQFSNRDLVSLLQNDMSVDEYLYENYREKDIKILEILLDRLRGM